MVGLFAGVSHVDRFCTHVQWESAVGIVKQESIRYKSHPPLPPLRLPRIEESVGLDDEYTSGGVILHSLFARCERPVHGTGVEWCSKKSGKR